MVMTVQIAPQAAFANGKRMVATQLNVVSISDNLFDNVIFKYTLMDADGAWAGESTFEIWKITDATSPDDYATGTLMATVGIGKWRFLHADGYKFVVRDTTTNYRVVVEAEKGIYMAELFFGAAVQLAQAAEVTEINNKVDVIAIDLDAIKGTGFVKDKHSLTNIKKKAALAAALSA